MTSLKLYKNDTISMNREEEVDICKQLKKHANVVENFGRALDLPENLKCPMRKVKFKFILFVFQY